MSQLILQMSDQINSLKTQNNNQKNDINRLCAIFDAKNREHKAFRANIENSCNRNPLYLNGFRIMVNDMHVFVGY